MGRIALFTHKFHTSGVAAKMNEETVVTGSASFCIQIQHVSGFTSIYDKG